MQHIHFRCRKDLSDRLDEHRHRFRSRTEILEEAVSNWLDQQDKELVGAAPDTRRTDGMKSNKRAKVHWRDTI